VLELAGVLRGSSRVAAPSEASFVRVVLAAALLPPLLIWVRVGGAGARLHLATGVVAGLCCVLLGFHVVARRVPRLRGRLLHRTRARAQRHGLASWRRLHEFGGVAAGFAVVAHAGARMPAGVSGALAVVFWLLTASGVALAVSYRLVPRRLSRLERSGSLPEDHAAERADLEARLFSELTGADRVKKELVRKLLAPYAFGLLGALSLALSGRSVAEERATVGARLERVFGGHRSERLANLAGLVETAVALRALRARRVLEAVLAVWPPLHLVLAILLGVLLVVHLVGVLG